MATQITQISKGTYIITQDAERLLCTDARDTGWGSFKETISGPTYNLPLDGLRVARDQTTRLPQQ